MPNDARDTHHKHDAHNVSAFTSCMVMASEKALNLSVVAPRDKELAVGAPFDGVDAAPVPVQGLHTLQTRHPTRQRGDLSVGIDE